MLMLHVYSESAGIARTVWLPSWRPMNQPTTFFAADIVHGEPSALVSDVAESQ